MHTIAFLLTLVISQPTTHYCRGLRSSRFPSDPEGHLRQQLQLATSTLRVCHDAISRRDHSNHLTPTRPNMRTVHTTRAAKTLVVRSRFVIPALGMRSQDFNLRTAVDNPGGCCSHHVKKKPKASAHPSSAPLNSYPSPVFRALPLIFSAFPVAHHSLSLAFRRRGAVSVPMILASPLSSGWMMAFGASLGMGLETRSLSWWVSCCMHDVQQTISGVVHTWTGSDID